MNSEIVKSLNSLIGLFQELVVRHKPPFIVTELRDGVLVDVTSERLAEHELTLAKYRELLDRALASES